MSERERRRAPRKAATLDVRYRVVGAEVEDAARDISIGGLFVACDDPLPLGAVVEVFLGADETSEHASDDALIVGAEVVRVVWGGRRAGEPLQPGMALRFDDMSASARDRLEALIAAV